MEPLSKTQHAELVSGLQDLQDQLNKLIANTEERAGTVHLDQSAVGRISRVDAMQQQKMAEHERLRQEAKREQVAQALKRVAEDSYGECARCGEYIGYPRLRAKPETPFCIQCASHMERR